MFRTHRRTLLGVLALAASAAAPLSAQSMSNDKAMAHDKMMAPTGTFTGSAGHSVSGTYALTGTGKERRLTLSSNFKMDDASDVRVMLSKGGMAKDGMAKDGMAKDGMAKDGMAKDGMAKGSGNLDLGKVKSSGAQEFKIPESADMGAYTSVVLWSKKDGTMVAQAPLGSAMDHGSMDHGSMAKDTGMMMKPMAKDTGMMMKKP